MTQIIRYSLILFLALSTVVSAQAQKIGYTNSQAILAEMPDVKRAEAELESLQKQMRTKYDQMIKRYQTQRGAVEKKYQDGLLSQVQLDQEIKKLGEEEKKIMKYEQDIMGQLQKKRAASIQPILKKVQDAIDAVSAEKGYLYIFDQSTGVLLYAKPEDDITGAVKSKLGM